MDKSLFPSTPTKRRTPTTNAAGGAAFESKPKEALAKVVLVGTLADNAYTPGNAQLKEILELCDQCGPDFTAKAAVYAKTKGNLKDMPVLLLAKLVADGHSDLAKSIFGTVCDTGKQVRNFVQILRSGAVGRKGLGSSARNMVRRWFDARDCDELYRNSHGNQPSMLDVLRLTKPRPKDEAHDRFYGWLSGKKEPLGLAAGVAAWAKDQGELPSRVPFELAAAHCQTTKQWTELAAETSWNATIKNLNTFARHGVFKQPGMVEIIANRLRQPPPKHVMPWSVYASYLFTCENADIPMPVRLAVQDALDNALRNVPEVPGNTVVLVDVSSSMGSPITGRRGSATSKISCANAAMLITAAYIKRNPETRLVTFAERAALVHVNPRDSVATMSRNIPFRGGGTNLAAGLMGIRQLDNVDNLLVVSDNQSWMDTNNQGGWYTQQSAGTAEQAWKLCQEKHSGISMACLDIAMESSIKIPEGRRVMHLAGAFSDYYWPFLQGFFMGELNTGRVVAAIEALEV